MSSLIVAGLVGLFALCVVGSVLVPWALLRRRRAGRSTATALVCGGPLPVRALDDDEELHRAETRLLEDLLAGRIDRPTYQSAMCRLAAVDAPRHPVTLPGEPI